MSKLTRIFKIVTVTFVYSVLCCKSAVADDIEVFFGGASTSTNSNPNILFIFDTSGSMSRSQSFTEVDENGNTVTVSQSRIGILQDVMSEVVSSLSGVNLGLSRFSVPGGPILFPVTDPDQPADPIVLKSLISANDDAVQTGNTVTLDSDYLNPPVAGPNGIIALRFQNVGIPQGAIINNATVLFTADQPSLDAGADYEIYAEVVPNAAPFATTIKNLSDRISGLPLTWIADPWNAILTTDYEVEPPTSFETPDISAVLQQVVDLKGATIDDPAGWCGGNDLVVLFKKIGTSGRPIIAYDKSADFSPKLRVDFDANIPTGEFGCYANTITRQVADKKHDSESGTGASNSTDLDFYKDTYYRENNDSVAISFENVGVPQGARVSSASLNFVSRSTSNGAAATTIYAVNSATPPLDSSVHSLPNGAFTAGVPWAIESWDYGVPYQSVDISAIVESVIALATWDEVSDFSFKLEGSSGTRTAYSFNGSRSRSPTLEITYIGAYTASAATKRQAMVATVEDFKATGNTPISDTYAEAGLYFKGENVKYGLVRGSPAKRDNRISHIDSIVSASGSIVTPAGCSASNPSSTACKDEKYVGTPVYQSPIVDSCQANHIILLTDGAPTSHNTATNALFENWTTELTGTTGTCRTNDSGADCTVKMAGLFNNNDLIPGTSDSESITTHTIGFYSDQAFLQDVADAGGGSYVTAFSKQELFDAINTIVDSILDVNTTFVSAGVTVNQYNRVTHSDELYFSLFTPASETVWPGNLKRYRLSDGQIVDFNENSAVTLSGEFDEAALSYWSPEVDGNEVEKGGAASQLTNARIVYSNLGGGSYLATSANRVIDGNSAVTSAMIGAVDSADRTKILNWTTGENVNDSTDPTLARQKMGDPLHSQPSLLIYEVSEDVFRTSVYVGSNDGFLHSFDTVSGNENWSFIPQELLPRLSELQKKTIGAHTYGMDGQITLYIHDDAGSPGVVEGSERAIIYIGMRRGGSSYYAIEVTDPDSPKLLFQIDPSMLGFSDLGLTWSKPVIKKMQIPGHETVMIFGGGYSTDQDVSGTASVVDSRGKNIYIVDAFTGELLWSIADAVDVSGISSAGSLSNMNAIPNEITAFDITGDGYIDHFYASDTKAQVFRFDIDADSGTIKGGRVAHLQTTPNAANNRRFYNKPDVSLVRTQDDNFVAIAIGSGYRAHPLDETVVDHFYMVKDEGILANIFDMDADMSDLVDVTSLIGDTDLDGVSDAAEIINDETSPKNGWYITFARSGEKVISNSITFSNAVIFTTYTPPGVSGAVCDAVAGTSRIYGMKITDGNPYIDSNYDGQLTELDRTATLTTAGIAPEPQILLEGSDSGVTPRLCVGNQCGLERFLPSIPKGVMGIRWHRNED